MPQLKVPTEIVFTAEVPVNVTVKLGKRGRYSPVR
jgi:hypothetical protein